MITIYDIKPKFQQLLRPIVKVVATRGITPNQVTWFTWMMCLVYAMFLMLFISSTSLLILFPLVLLLRMALNAIDGLLAKEYQKITPLGAILNELTDMSSDAALYLPFALYPGLSSGLIIIIIILSLISEAAGLTGLLIHATRRYDGPMGKSDRAFVFSLLALILAFSKAVTFVNLVLGLMVLLLILTIRNRVVESLKEVSELNETELY